MPGSAASARPTPTRNNAFIGTGLALLFGIALLVAGASLTSKLGGDGSSATDGARLLRQARFLPERRRQQQERQRQAQELMSTEDSAQQAPAFAALVTTSSPDRTASSKLVSGGCLISKWGAVWLVHADGKTRSHVAMPTAECDLHASEVDNLDNYIKSHGGEGAYTLDEQTCVAACRRPGCHPSSSAGKDPYPGAGGKDPLAEPPNGWGNGAGPGWQQRSGLQFNDAALTAFAEPARPAGEPLLLVFGGATVNDMLRNWALHARKNTGMLYAVACMDDKLFHLANEHGIPAVMMRASAGGSDGAVTTRWKYYRMDPKAFMQMGILKARFFMEFLRAGFDLLCSDLDVVWLSDPRPFLSGREQGTDLLPFADIVVSTDVTSGINDNDRGMDGSPLTARL